MPETPDHGRLLTFETTLESTSRDVRAVLGTVTRGLCGAGWEPQACHAVELVLAEALNNIVEHAYAERADGKIGLSACVTAEAIELIIRDFGVAMPGQQLPAGDPVPLEDTVQSLPEGGFGWYLIRKLSDRLVYRRKDGLNRLEIRVLRRAGNTGP